MKKIILFATLLAGMWILSACTQQTAAPTEPEVLEAPAAAAPGVLMPRFINHPQPETSPSLAAFTFGGCDETSGLCPPNSQVGQLGCQKVVARDQAGGLTPPIPAAWCLVEVGQPANLEAFIYEQHPNPRYRSIVVFNAGQYFLVSDPTRFVELYAPIESPAEALSLSLILINADALYNQAILPTANYLVGSIEDTHVASYPEYYQVNLFSSEQTAACERTTYQDIIRVTHQGQVILLSKEALYTENTCP